MQAASFMRFGRLLTPNSQPIGLCSSIKTALPLRKGVLAPPRRLPNWRHVTTPLAMAANQGINKAEPNIINTLKTTVNLILPGFAGGMGAVTLLGVIQEFIGSQSDLIGLLNLVLRVAIFTLVSFPIAASAIPPRLQGATIDDMVRLGNAWADAIEEINAAVDSGKVKVTEEGALEPPLEFHFPVFPQFPSVDDDPGYLNRMKVMGLIFGAATVFTIYWGLANFGFPFYKVLSIDHINLSIAGGAVGFDLARFQAHALWDYAETGVKAKKDFEKFVKTPLSEEGKKTIENFMRRSGRM